MKTETDALRYKWLRDYMLSDHEFFDDNIMACRTIEEFDATIDGLRTILPFGVKND